MEGKKISFQEFKSRLGKCLEQVDYSKETSENRFISLKDERHAVKVSESSYKSTASHLKRQFSL